MASGSGRVVWSLIGLLLTLLGQVVECQVARPMSRGPTKRLAAADQELDASNLSQWLQSPVAESVVYKCAKHCSCSIIRVPDWEGDAAATAAYRDPKLQPPRQMVNVSQVKCENPHFSDLLTIDRRTQIIHISLPTRTEQHAKSPESNPPATASSRAPKRNQMTLMSKLFNLSSAAQNSSTLESKAYQMSPAAGSGGYNQFRMPRLTQFTMLREIIIVNLRIEVCDSEVFKRGQRLLKLKWNGNSLKQVSRSCFKHLDKLFDLNLDHNQLDELESALFSHLGALKRLSLAHNQLTDLAAHQFANLSQLISLNLVGNSFKVINLNLLEPMQNSLQLLALANNQIRSFVLNQPAQSIAPTSTSNQSSSAQQSAQVFSGVIFRNLIKLNVDFNRFERIKLLQLHRFFNVKFLSIRGNNIATIRDKAFNGLKLVELNLAQNRLQSISRCAFCNSTIKRLNLAENNISAPSFVGPTLNAAAAHPLVAVDPLVVSSATNGDIPQPAAAPLVLGGPPASSASMLVLGQSIFGPLFNHLEYLDLSYNVHLADQLELLLEPLLELQYLNLAAIGLDRSLPSPSLFKNLRRLTYLNLSHNHLDQIVMETIEPLTELQLLDLSRNDLSELEESFLVTLDELPMMKLVDFGSNPWYCSQCKISSLYEWILRSPIYNATCLSQPQGKSPGPDEAGADKMDSDEMSNELDEKAAVESSLGFIYKQQARSSSGGATSRASANTYSNQLQNDVTPVTIDFELILDLFQDDSSFSDMIDGVSTSARSASSSSSANVPNYQFDDSISLQQEFRDRKRQLSRRLLRSLAGPDDDNSISKTIESVHAVAEAFGSNTPDLNEGDPGVGDRRGTEQVLKKFFPNRDFCLKCEFPSELRSFYLHELVPTDFRYCAGSAPRTGASEPKVGLTLAIVIISVLLVVIIVVIVMYRKKSNTYYVGEDLLESAEDGQASGRKSRPVLSVSSDMDHQYGDATDYSSPPMSQTYSNEDSLSGSNSREVADEDDELDGEDEEEVGDEDEDEDEDEGEKYDEDEEDEEEEDAADEEEGDHIDDDGRDDPDDRDNEGGAHGRRDHIHFPDMDAGDHDEHRSTGHRPPPGPTGHRGQSSLDDVSSPPAPSSASKQEDRHGQATTNPKHPDPVNSNSSHLMSPAGEKVTAISRTNLNERSKSRLPSNMQQQQAPNDSSNQPSIGMAKRRMTKRGKSQVATISIGGTNLAQMIGRGDQDEDTQSRQSSHFDRDDSTPIYIARYETNTDLPRRANSNSSNNTHTHSSNNNNGTDNNNDHRHQTQALVTSSTPASLSVGDVLDVSPPSLVNSTAESITIADSATTPTSHRTNDRKVDGARQRLVLGKLASMSPGSQDNQRDAIPGRKIQQRSADMSGSETASRPTATPRQAKHQRQPTGSSAFSPAGESITQDDDKPSQGSRQPVASVSVINVDPGVLQQRQQLAVADHQREGNSLGRHKNTDRRQHRQSSEQSTTGSVSFANVQPVSPDGPGRVSAQAIKLMRSVQTIACDRDEDSDRRGVSIVQLVGEPTRHKNLTSYSEREADDGITQREFIASMNRVQNGRVDQTRAEPTTDSDTIRSNSKDSSRMQQFGDGQRLPPGSSRGRSLVKQRPREHHSPPASLAARRLMSGELKPAAPAYESSQPAEKFSSAELDEDDARLLDELASDLDESSADVLTASDSAATKGGPRGRLRPILSASYQTQSGPALDFDEEEEEEEEEEQRASGEESIEQLHGLGLMRMSQSTHSALTRAGSGDFE